MTDPAACIWNCSGGMAIRLAPFCVMGVVNVTPDSFFDGGLHDTGPAALQHALALAEQGARILDLGGESTRPGAEQVSADVELERIVPLVRALAGQGLTVSVDTTKAIVARQAVEAGAAIVNDVSGCRFDPELMDVLAQYRPGYVLMHSQGRPRDMQRNPCYGDIVNDVFAFFEERLAALTRAGLPEEHIVLDPGIGFGKRLEHNLALLRATGRFLALGRPLLIGLSNKSLWGDLLGLALRERAQATQVATALLAWQGVSIHRVHDVAATAQTLRIVSALRKRGIDPELTAGLRERGLGSQPCSI